MHEETRGEMEPQDRDPEWMSNRPLAVLARLALLAGMAIAIAVSVSELLGAEKKITPIVESQQR